MHPQVGKAARGLTELPLAAEPATLPRDGGRPAGPGGEGPAGSGLPRRRADGHRGTDPARGQAGRDARDAAQAPARARARSGLQVRRQAQLLQLH